MIRSASPRPPSRGRRRHEIVDTLAVLFATLLIVAGAVGVALLHLARH
jgi:hypothetical protein